MGADGTHVAVKCGAGVLFAVVLHAGQVLGVVDRHPDERLLAQWRQGDIVDIVVFQKIFVDGHAVKY